MPSVFYHGVCRQVGKRVDIQEACYSVTRAMGFTSNIVNPNSMGELQMSHKFLSKPEHHMHANPADDGRMVARAQRKAVVAGAERSTVPTLTPQTMEGWLLGRKGRQWLLGRKGALYPR
jgi:hypothetical protein